MIVDIIFGIIVPFVLLVVAGYLLKKFHNDEVIKWVGIAVEAAEQIYRDSGMGKEKFDYVSKWISEKFKISEDDLKNLIESAVYKLNSKTEETKQKE